MFKTHTLEIELGYGELNALADGLGLHYRLSGRMFAMHVSGHSQVKQYPFPLDEMHTRVLHAGVSCMLVFFQDKGTRSSETCWSPLLLSLTIQTGPPEIPPSSAGRVNYSSHLTWQKDGFFFSNPIRDWESLYPCPECLN